MVVWQTRQTSPWSDLASHLPRAVTVPVPAAIAGPCGVWTAWQSGLPPDKTRPTPRTGSGHSVLVLRVAASFVSEMSDSFNDTEYVVLTLPLLSL